MRRRRLDDARRLRLHRETLRVLAAPALARVAGGTGEVLDTAQVDERDTQLDTKPKTNGWTGREGIDLARVCTVAGG